ncbi:uncharacterized protein A4U43_C07F23920 [Asparagus officinalis]|uniref:Pentacotripeptide-repeat region of PRORP domain-containing protein n=1 Tax=Asparagus officinalis TaxID=4686 RepID=A0A5P1EEI1_ASPOF|nr:uncharacterized protein A4U43_C07F23920 [Asparagus officinalis]
MMSREAKARPSQKTYNILIKAWCDQKNFSEAWNAVYKMCASGMRPDVVTYNTIARDYAENGETKRDEDMVLEMENELRPNECTLAIIVRGYCKEAIGPATTTKEILDKLETIFYKIDKLVLHGRGMDEKTIVSTIINPSPEHSKFIEDFYTLAESTWTIEQLINKIDH